MKQPPFCPSSSCSNHHSPPSRWYWRNGYYRNRRGKKVQRYRCRSCGKKFSERTFSLDYYAHRSLPYRQLLFALTSGTGLRALSRRFGVSHKVICNRTARLARQSLAVTAQLRKEICLCEDLVADGFESFVKSQYFPNNIHILVGKDSQYLFAVSYAHIRRKGRMTERQKRKRELIEKELSKLSFIPRKIYYSFLDICDRITELIESAGERQITLYTDRKNEYLQALSCHPLVEMLRSQERFNHQRESSKVLRTIRNILFAVNYIDREFRKGQANHARETVQFSRDVNSLMDRMLLHQLYHNYFKPYRIGKTEYKAISHAQMAGIRKKTINSQLKTVFTRRRFFSKEALPFAEQQMWLRGLETPLKTKEERLPDYLCA